MAGTRRVCPSKVRAALVQGLGFRLVCPLRQGLAQVMWSNWCEVYMAGTRRVCPLKVRVALVQGLGFRLVCPLRQGLAQMMWSNWCGV